MLPAEELIPVVPGAAGNDSSGYNGTASGDNTSAAPAKNQTANTLLDTFSSINVLIAVASINDHLLLFFATTFVVVCLSQKYCNPPLTGSFILRITNRNRSGTASNSLL